MQVFLETAYGYDSEQSDMLAEFITIYNAVHRSDMEYFSVHYKEIVIRSLEAEKAGISLSYLDWPGNSMLVIPLTPEAGTGVTGDIATDLLSEDKVIDELRTEEDRGVDFRQKMVELKEDEIDEQREAIRDERKDLEQTSDRLEEQKAELEKEAEQTDDQAKLDEIQDDINKIDEQQKAVDEKQAALDEQEKELSDREDKIVQEREDIASDQAEKIREEAAADESSGGDKAVSAPVKKVPFLKLSGTEGNYTGQLVLVDSSGGSIIKSSDIDSLRLRGYHFSDDEIISVAGSTGGNRVVSLVKIDPESLEVTETGTAEVYIDSAIVKSGSSYYAVVKNGADWKIGIFDKKLVLESVSGEAVFPATDIMVNSSGVIAQAPSGRIILIGEDDFTEGSF